MREDTTGITDTTEGGRLDNRPQNFSDRLVDNEVCVAVARCFIFINKYELIPAIVVYQSGGRIYGQGCSPDYKHVGFSNVVDRALKYTGIQPFLIEDDIRLYNAAA